METVGTIIAAVIGGIVVIMLIWTIIEYAWKSIKGKLKK